MQKIKLNRSESKKNSKKVIKKSSMPILQNSKSLGAEAKKQQGSQNNQKNSKKCQKTSHQWIIPQTSSLTKTTQMRTQIDSAKSANLWKNYKKNQWKVEGKGKGGQI
jgi:hypothetical protein